MERLDKWVKMSHVPNMWEEALESMIQEGFLDAWKALVPKELAGIAVAAVSVTFSC